MIAQDEKTIDMEMLAINERLVIAGIRQQELAEIALRAEQRLNDLVHGLDAVICEVDIRSGMPTFLSLRAGTFLDQPLDHWQRQTDFLAEIIHPRDRERVTAGFPTLMREGRNHEYEFRAQSSDDNFVWMRNIVRVVYDADGQVECCAA